MVKVEDEAGPALRGREIGDRDSNRQGSAPTTGLEDHKPQREEGRASPQEDRRADPSAQDDHGDKTPDDKREGSPRKPGNLLRRHPLAALAAAGLVVVAAIAGIIWWIEASKFESTDDAFISARQFTVSPKVSGFIKAVAVTDNQVVKAGNTLTVIDDRDYITALAQAEAQLAQAEASVPNIDAQIAGQEAQIVSSQAQVKDAEAALTFAKEEDQRGQQLASNGAGTVQRAQQTRSALIQAQATLDRAKAGLSAAEKQLTALKAQRVSAEANVAQSRAQRDQAQINLGYTVVKADQAGRVVQLTAAKGQLVQAGQSLMIIVPDPLWVVANFRETQIQEMKPGQPVDIRIDAYSNRVFKGHLDSIQSGSGTVFSLLPAENATGNYVKVVQRVPVKIVFDEVPDVIIGPGMSVVPTVRVKQ